MANAIMGLNKTVRGGHVYVSVLLMYDIPAPQQETDLDGNPIVLTPSAGLPAESELGTSPITPAEKNEFDIGTSVWAVREFLLRPGMDAAAMAAEARKLWASQQAILFAEYQALAGTWEYTGVRISPT